MHEVTLARIDFLLWPHVCLLFLQMFYYLRSEQEHLGRTLSAAVVTLLVKHDNYYSTTTALFYTADV